MKTILKIGLMTGIVGILAISGLNASPNRAYVSSQQSYQIHSDKPLNKSLESMLKKLRESTIKTQLPTPSSPIIVVKEKEYVKNPIHVVIDPGHYPYSENRKHGTYNNKENFDEYTMNQIVADQTRFYFSFDPRFKSELTKTNGDYTPELKKFIKENHASGKEILKRKNDPYNKHVENVGSNPLPTEELIPLYLSRHYAKDIFLTLHQDANYPEYHGFSIIVSPFNEKYAETRDLAMAIADRFTQFKDTTHQSLFNNIDDFIKKGKLSKNEEKILRAKGVRLRRKLPLLGNYKDPAQNLAVMTEGEFISHVKLDDYEYIKNYAYAEYAGTCDHFGFRPLPKNIFSHMCDLYLSNNFINSQ